MRLLPKLSRTPVQLDPRAWHAATTERRAEFGLIGLDQLSAAATVDDALSVIMTWIRRGDRRRVGATVMLDLAPTPDTSNLLRFLAISRPPADEG